jgi:hypothetical protein
MKLFTIALSALALCGAALAATVDTVNVRFSTPVMVGEKVLPAGDVTFNVIHGTSSVLLTARAANGESAVVVVSRLHESDEPARSSVILGRSGNNLRVERVWLEDGVGFAIADAQ